MRGKVESEREEICAGRGARECVCVYGVKGRGVRARGRVRVKEEGLKEEYYCQDGENM